MTPKSSYALFAAFPLIDMLFQIRPMGISSAIMHAAVCGAALYYVIKHLKPFGIMSGVMLALAVVFNPFRPFELGTPGWIVADIIAMALFYLLSWKTPLPDNGGVKHYSSEEEYNDAHK